MPPRGRNKRAVDILDRVLETASLPHSVDIDSLKQEIEEQLRVLRIRAPKLGKGDTNESRKLVLLEQILRASSSNASTNHSLTTQTLAKAVGMKAAAFENLRFQVAQYVDVSKSNSSKKKSPRVGSSSSSNVSHATPGFNPSGDDGPTTTSTIPALSIRLGPQVHDSHGFAQRAQQLFTDMARYVGSTSTISSQNKRGYLQDMERSRPAYEAACFFLVAKGRKLKRASVATTNSRNNDASLLEEEEDVHQLSIQDILQASGSVSASQFRDILPTVEKFTCEMEASRHEKDSKQSASKASQRKRGRPKNNGQEDGKPTVENDTPRALLDGVEATAATCDAKRCRLDLLEETTPIFVYNPKFLEWKKRKLQETTEAMKQAIAWERGTDAESISDSDGISRAADENLRRHGLRPAKPTERT